MAAWFIDCLCIVAWIGVTAAIGIPLYLTGVTRDASVVAVNLIAFMVMVVPVTIALAALESSVREATFAKRARRFDSRWRDG